MAWLDDIEDPVVREAYRIVGNQSDASLRKMIWALELIPMMNTAEDNTRLEAAKIVRAYRAKQKKAARRA